MRRTPQGPHEAELEISGYRVRRFDFHAAPRCIELDDALREKLTLS